MISSIVGQVKRGTRRKIENSRKALLASIAELQDLRTRDPGAHSLVLTYEHLLDMVTRLPFLVSNRVTHADAVILTRGQMQELLACFGLDLLALHGGVEASQKE